jgi:hypothetical protein
VFTLELLVLARVGAALAWGMDVPVRRLSAVRVPIVSAAGRKQGIRDVKWGTQAIAN